MSKSSEVKTIFEVVDPQHNVVTLSQATYDDHIVTRHPEMEDQEIQIQKCVENPDKITKDPDYNTRGYYRDHGDSTLRNFGLYTKVAVNIDSGTIRTAYFTDNMKSGDKILWKK
jgi:hypothetical protein